VVDWKINPAGVQEVLTKTQTAAEPFDGLAKTYGDDLTNIMHGLDYDVFRIVGGAIGEYSAHWAPILEGAAKQVGASLTGAQNATLAYMNGQQEMARNAMAEAGRGEIPLPPGSKMPSGPVKAV
jgi:hypothetical protein